MKILRTILADRARPGALTNWSILTQRAGVGQIPLRTPGADERAGRKAAARKARLGDNAWRPERKAPLGRIPMALLEQILTAAAHEQGFVLVGFAPLRRLDNRAEFFNRWLAEGRAGEMGWLGRDPERRFDPRRIDPRLRSVVSLGYPYAAPAIPDLDWRAAMRGRIAAYALGPDYHDTVLARARAVAARLKDERPDAVTRAYVDTGAVFEREWAAEARIGWFGRNTNLLNRHHGSYFFLAEIFTDAEFEPSGEPYREHCGTCRQCLDLCPTGALAAGYVIEPRVCISYLTIEHRGPIPAELRSKLGNWIFGCDVCQEVCPWNVSDGRGA